MLRISGGFSSDVSQVEPRGASIHLGFGGKS